MSDRASRRQFLQASAATGIGFWVAAGARAQDEKKEESPNDRIAMASIGIGGKGSSDSEDAGRHGDMVAICDVDKKRLEGTARRFPKAKTYTDFRKMLDEMGPSIDAVTVSTPDHTHTAAALMAMRMGKHCFCQKPLTHTIHEARLMGKVAREMGVATQMGNQGTAENGLREAAAMIRAGMIGTVNEVHVWTNRPIWPQGGGRPESVPCPEHIEWDLWLGPARERPYGPGYHPFAWRGFWDFGTGALGDMACHTMNMPFAALDLRNPVSVEAETWDDYAKEADRYETYPKWSIITFEFPANDARPAVKVMWYDGGKLPSTDLVGGRKLAESGCMVIGEKGTVFSPNDYGAEFEIIGDVTKPEVEIDKSPGHFEEWVRAIKGGPAAMSNFPDYAGPLTETILLGNLALRAQHKVEWDAENLQAKGAAWLDEIVKPTYRAGYVLDV
ncbi:MAG: Gfo/Idh/MocA family oxidoreductase [Pirellulales bacterium]|nr:Gfo/Idh/MocA family oxidoreductase [Pirellulales bacterium]